MKNTWQLTRINQRWAVSRETYFPHNAIEYRELNWFEKIKYYFKMRQHDKMYPNWKGVKNEK